jgi:hypothetical protein
MNNQAQSTVKPWPSTPNRFPRFGVNAVDIAHREPSAAFFTTHLRNI